MANETLYGQTKTFKLPSGYEVTIREQNGEDDDILSNQDKANDLRNISAFISSIVVDTDFTPNRLLSESDAHKLPALDRYAILFNSRIFSLSDILEFEYNWGTKEKPLEYAYEVDLKDFIFDYGVKPTEEILSSKPDAIPYYPNGKKIKNIEINTTSGKELTFDILTGEGESYMLNLPLGERTKNKELIARNLKLKVGENYESVKNFRMFSVKDMVEIRSMVKGLDPAFTGTTQIKNPNTGEELDIPVMAVSSFFYLREN